MSGTQQMTTLEILPNEILLHCFEYLNAFHIFHSFNQLNHRFNCLICDTPLYINLEGDINKSVFDRFCIKMMLNPQIKDQVHSLKLPSPQSNNAASLQATTFLSFFSLAELQNLQRFQTTAYEIPIPMDTTSSHFREQDILDVCIESFPKLRALSMQRLLRRPRDQLNPNLSITKLRVYICNMDDIYDFLKCVPMLKYLHINDFYFSNDSSNEKTKESWLYLERLILDQANCCSFDRCKAFVKLTPNLKSLTISSDTKDLIDAAEWERLITISLPHLDVFQFMFLCFYLNDEQEMIMSKFREFHTDFWQKRHNWFTEYSVIDDEALIYTIPFAPNMDVLEQHREIYRHNFKDNLNTFVNVRKLMIDEEMLRNKCEVYFPNVISLELHMNLESLSIEQTERLVKIVNPFHVKFLDISHVYNMNSSLLLKLFDQMSQLSGLSVERSVLAEFLNDGELCKYLRKVQRLHLMEFGWWITEDDLFPRNKFYEVFSNIKHLRLEHGRGIGLLSSLSRLPKLSTFEAQWVTRKSPELYRSQMASKVEQLNAIHKISIETDEDSDDDSSDTDSDHDWYRYYGEKRKKYYYTVEICIWLGNNMS
ncbi:unnamed protein product [Adineta ricciae]|uniref:F-box domain-containing protein n=1 Tax=Adineta ricciae TaxID=249248 RepID=A0A813RV87_ADIRI|nr:unnamed protein product [Adineta ricciae]CAF1473500.1 unnamed protein product [Adineta ricciae]